MRTILWVNGWPDVGGAERAQLNLFRHLVKTDRILAVLADDAQPRLVAEIEALGIAVQRVPLTRLRQTLDPLALARFAYRFFRATVALSRLLRREAPDIIHTAYLYDIPFCAPSARLAGVPLFWLIENPERFGRLNTAVLNGCRLSGYAGTSTPILAAAREHGVKARTVGLLPNSYDERFFYRAERQRARRDTLHIGFAGILEDRKGVVELCEAFGIVKQMLQREARHRPRLRLMLAGDGEAVFKRTMFETLQRFAAADDVTVLSSLKTPHQMRDFYQDLDIYVMLSKREGLSVAMLEALACGIPSVLVSPWGDDVIEDGVHGLRLPNADPATAARALRTLVIDADLRASLGCAAAARMQAEFASEHVARRLGELYDRILSASARPRRQTG
jgi:glycosyltransferase involved in cell wall biosynthesis